MGILQILLKGKVGETYNIGGCNEWKNIDTVKLLCEIVDHLFEENSDLRTRFLDSPASKGKKCESLITFVEDRPGHDVRYAIDASKICQELGYKPEVEFREGLTKTVKWYLSNEAWWRSVKDGSYKNACLSCLNH